MTESKQNLQSSDSQLPIDLSNIKLTIDDKADGEHAQKELTIVLARLSQETKSEEISALFDSVGLKYKSISSINKEKALSVLGLSDKMKSRSRAGDASEALPNYLIDEPADAQSKKRRKRNDVDLASDESAYMLLTFETRDDMNQVVHRILFEKTLKVNGRRLYMVHHRQNGNYNPETSVYIGMLNPRCTEEEIVEELNLVLRDDRLKRAKAKQAEQENASKEENGEGQESSEKKAVDTQCGLNHFILSAIVIIDQNTHYSKRFAFVDFNCSEAADLCISTWNNCNMKSYPNRLVVTRYDTEHQKLTKSQREASRNRGSPERQRFTNLYVDKLPYNFEQQHVMQLFHRYEPLSAIVKKPVSNVPLFSENSYPCSAYVSFRTEEQARMAALEFNGKPIMAGANRLRVEPYQRANRFFGPLSGLNKHELISNTHFRVLFIRGLFKDVSRDELKKVCQKFGEVQTLTLKTKIEENKIMSRGIAIVQYSQKSEASEALKKLPFETQLGDLLDVDFFMSKESRMQELEAKNGTIQAATVQQNIQVAPALLPASDPLSQLTQNLAGVDTRVLNQALVRTLESIQPLIMAQKKIKSKKKPKKKAASPNEKGNAAPEASNKLSKKRSASVNARTARSQGRSQSKQRSTTTKDDTKSRSKSRQPANQSVAVKKQTGPVKMEYRPKQSKADKEAEKKEDKPESQGADQEQKKKKKKKSKKKAAAQEDQAAPAASQTSPKNAATGGKKKQQQQQPIYEYQVKKPAQVKDKVLVEIPEGEFNKLTTFEEKQNFIGNYLYQCVYLRLDRECRQKYADECKKLAEQPSSTATGDEITLCNNLLMERLQHVTGRITGMIIDGQSIEFIRYLCKSQKAFEEMVQEAMGLLIKAEGKLI